VTSKEKIAASREQKFLMKILSHEAGYSVDLMGFMRMHTTEHGTIEMTFPRKRPDPFGDANRYRSFPISDLKLACGYFVAVRHSLKLGVDHEVLLNKKVTKKAMKKVVFAARIKSE
jgi:hypothetical protein